MLNVKTFSYLDCLHKLNKTDAQMIRSEKPHQLMSAGELVFMASPTLACDGPQEDSIEFEPVLFVAITRRNVKRVGEQLV